ncbi:MAG: PKD domain-containing protein, partial [Candidatus Kariarchaeaceae archaeon]
MVSRTQERGIAGAFATIAILLGSMAYFSSDIFYRDLNDLNELEEDGIFVDSNIAYMGEEVLFHLKPTLLSPLYGIKYFVWDFHDGDNLYISTTEDTNVGHTFINAGEFTVSILAMRGNISKIFTVDMTILPPPQDIEIIANSSSILENEPIKLKATTKYNYQIINYLWEFGDSETAFGQVVHHNYTEEGIYTVRVRGYTIDSLIYTGFKEIEVINKVPEVNFLAPVSENEDTKVRFTADVLDSLSDMDSLSYIWDFGNGLMDSGPEVEHIFPEKGIYTVNLTVIDNNGAVASKVKDIEILNKQPIINSLWNYRDYYTEGETITTFADIMDDMSDMSSLTYDWSVPGDGSQSSAPFFDNGTYKIDLTVTDADGAKTNDTTDPFEVINVNPYASLISAYAEYNVTFRIWGTINSTAEIYIIREGENIHNISIISTDLIRNTSTGVLVENLLQSIDDYWEIFINSSNAGSYDAFVETTFSFENHPSIAIINHCTNETSTCIAESYRFPVAPIDRGFPIHYNFSVFDPGNDNVTLHLNVGSNSYKSTLIQTGDYTTGYLGIIGSLPIGEDAWDIYYYIEDMDGGRSRNYSLPMVDHSKLKIPDEFVDKKTWFYGGHTISYFAPVAHFYMDFEIEAGKSDRYIIQAAHPDTASLRYTWHFGSGGMSLDRFPTYIYEFEGSYLLWVKVSDDYYDYISHKWINVVNIIPEHHAIIQGIMVEGSSLNFMVSKNSPNEYVYHWDFGDGTTGFGSNYVHKYSKSGNYSIVLTIVDPRFNTYDVIELQEFIFDAAPFTREKILSSQVLVEGNNVVFTPNVQDSPHDMLSLSYSWDINGDIYNNHSLWFSVNDPLNYGTLLVEDDAGNNFTQSFTFNISSNPFEITVLTKNFLYGDTNRPMHISGTISPSIFNLDYREKYSIVYQLFGKDGSLLDEGTGVFNNDFHVFMLEID